MDEISIDSYKTIKFIAKHGRIKSSVTDEIINQLLLRGYIVPTGEDYYFEPTEDGKAYLDTKRWFTLKYIVTQLLIPVLVGVLASIITNVLLKS